MMSRLRKYHAARSIVPSHGKHRSDAALTLALTLGLALRLVQVLQQQVAEAVGRLERERQHARAAQTPSSIRSR
jgi:hypothetical protein